MSHDPNDLRSVEAMNQHLASLAAKSQGKATMLGGILSAAADADQKHRTDKIKQGLESQGDSLEDALAALSKASGFVVLVHGDDLNKVEMLVNTSHPFLQKVVQGINTSMSKLARLNLGRKRPNGGQL